MLGISVGWLEEEFSVLGVPFEKCGRRAGEYVAALRELWSADSANYQGDSVNIKDTYCKASSAQQIRTDYCWR